MYELHESDVTIGRLNFGRQLLHEVIVDHVEYVKGHHIFKLEQDRPVRWAHVA